MKGCERAQALVEALVALPVCVACALALVDGGVLVRDRIAVAQAATRAAEAEFVGAPARAAALGALPAARREHARVRVDAHAGTVLVEVDGGSRIAGLVGRHVRLASTAAFE